MFSFPASVPSVFSVTRFFGNHSNMWIWCSKKSSDESSCAA